MTLTPQQKQQAVDKQMDGLTDAAIIDLVCELNDERARLVAHVVQRRLKQLRLRTVVSTVAIAMLIGG